MSKQLCSNQQNTQIRSSVQYNLLKVPASFTVSISGLQVDKHKASFLDLYGSGHSHTQSVRQGACAEEHGTVRVREEEESSDVEQGVQALLALVCFLICSSSVQYTCTLTSGGIMGRFRLIKSLAPTDLESRVCVHNLWFICHVIIIAIMTVLSSSCGFHDCMTMISAYLFTCRGT